MTQPADTMEWGWEAHRKAQERRWAELSPMERLSWLEEAIRFAHERERCRGPETRGRGW